MEAAKAWLSTVPLSVAGQRIDHAFPPVHDIDRAAMNYIYDTMYSINCTILLTLAAVEVPTFTLPHSNSLLSCLATTSLLSVFFATLSTAFFRLVIKFPCNHPDGIADDILLKDVTRVGRVMLAFPMAFSALEMLTCFAYMIVGVEELLPSAPRTAYVVGAVLLTVVLFGSSTLFVLMGRRRRSTPNVGHGDP